ncbi:MAG: hypothetical protein DRI34_06510, partial [Deltaproteobacteria bacterium]
MKLGSTTASVIMVAVLFSGIRARAEAPTRVITTAAEQVRAILKNKVKKGSAAERLRKKMLKQVVDGFLDYHELARLSLGPHWQERNNKEQREFTRLLRELIEASYLSTISDNINFKLKIEEEEIAEEGDKASVWAVASAKNSKQRTVSEDLTFHLFLKDKKWFIYDIEFGDVSLVRHYRGEFHRKI